MKKFSLTFLSLVFLLCPILSQAQDNTRAVIRFVGCTIDEGFTFDQVVDKAKRLNWGENSPNAVFFRRPIYSIDALMESTDILIAAYYTNHSEMVERRVALGADSRGNLPISCGAPSVWRSYNVTENFGPFDQTAMLTHRCTLNAGVTPRSAFNRVSAVVENYAAAGDDSLVQMNLPSLGGGGDDRDFFLAVVGSSAQNLTRQLDMRFEGFRGELGNNSVSSFSCETPNLWSTTTIYSANN